MLLRAVAVSANDADNGAGLSPGVRAECENELEKPAGPAVTGGRSGECTADEGRNCRAVGGLGPIEDDNPDGRDGDEANAFRDRGPKPGEPA